MNVSRGFRGSPAPIALQIVRSEPKTKMLLCRESSIWFAGGLTFSDHQSRLPRMVMPMAARRATAALTGIAFSLGRRLITQGHPRVALTGLILGGEGFGQLQGNFSNRLKSLIGPK